MRRRFLPGFLPGFRSVNLGQQPHDLPAHVRVRRQQVDQVREVGAGAVTDPEQLGGRGVALGLVTYQGAAQEVAGLGWERRQRGAEVGVVDGL